MSTTQQRATPEQALLDALVGIARASSVRDALQAATDLTAEVLDADAVFAWRDDGGERITVASGADVIDALAQTWQVLAGSDVLRTTLDATDDAVLTALGWTSVAILRAPLAGGGTLLSVRRSADREFSESDERHAQALAEQTTFALQHLASATERERLTQELRNAERLKTEFVAMTSHELRTPLTSIRAATSMVRSYWDTITDERKLRLLEVIEGQAQRLSRLVENILAAANIEAGVVLPRVATVDLAAAVDDVARDCGAELDVVVDVERPLLAEADADHTRQILVNFVGNSLKYGDPPVSITGRRRRDMIELRVTDCGPGVPADFIPRLFDRFTQASSGDTRRASGSGLGLSIVKGLAEAVGGSVRYEDNTPKGSCFVVTLPAAEDD